MSHQITTEHVGRACGSAGPLFSLPSSRSLNPLLRNDALINHSHINKLCLPDSQNRFADEVVLLRLIEVC